MDSCGHGICVKCVVLNNSCLVCEGENTKEPIGHSSRLASNKSPVLLKKPTAKETYANDVEENEFEFRPLITRKKLDMSPFSPFNKKPTNSGIESDDIMVLDFGGSKPKPAKYLNF